MAARWDPPAAVVACLSARSGLDLLLAAVDWPPGSEVLLSAVTIPHLAVLVRAHGYVAVALDLDLATLRLDPDDVRVAWTPRTRALVYAHLLGAEEVVDDLAHVAGELGLLLVEDRAESYDGRDRGLGEHADVSLHSFGTIKTSSCLGGGVVLVRDTALRDRMLAQQARWPVQRPRTYAAKLVKGAVMLTIGHPAVYPWFVRVAETLTGDYDRVVRSLSRGYADDRLLEQVRRQPCTALLALMAHRFADYDPGRVEARRRAGDQLAAALDPGVTHLGGGGRRATHWLFAVVSRDPAALVAAGRTAGFDLTCGSSTIVALGGPGTRTHAALREVVFLPAYAGLSAADLDRLAAVVNTTERKDLPADPLGTLSPVGVAAAPPTSRRRR